MRILLPVLLFSFHLSVCPDNEGDNSYPSTSVNAPSYFFEAQPYRPTKGVVPNRVYSSDSVSSLDVPRPEKAPGISEYGEQMRRDSTVQSSFFIMSRMFSELAGTELPQVDFSKVIAEGQDLSTKEAVKETGFRLGELLYEFMKECSKSFEQILAPQH